MLRGHGTGGGEGDSVRPRNRGGGGDAARPRNCEDPNSEFRIKKTRDWWREYSRFLNSEFGILIFAIPWAGPVYGSCRRMQETAGASTPVFLILNSEF